MRKLSQKLAMSAALLTATATLAGAQVLLPMPAFDSGAPALLLRVHHETDAAAAGPANILSTLPESWTVADWTRQNVYDLADNKIGEIADVLLDHDGKAQALIIGVGGFLGISEKDVAVAFDAVHFKNKDNKWQLIMNTTKDVLKGAQGYRFDRNARKWMPENASETIGSGGSVPRPNAR